MAVRRQINRYRTEPYGEDFDSVLKRAKRFFTIGDLHEPFMMFEYRGAWNAFSLPAWGSLPQGAIVYRWNGKRWQTGG